MSGNARPYSPFISGSVSKSKFGLFSLDRDEDEATDSRSFRCFNISSAVSRSVTKLVFICIVSCGTRRKISLLHRQWKEAKDSRELPDQGTENISSRSSRRPRGKNTTTVIGPLVDKPGWNAQWPAQLPLAIRVGLSNGQWIG